MRKVLNNGITVRTSRTDKSDSVCLILKLSGGAAWEEKIRRGITHLVEHLCFRRFRGMSQADFYYEIEKIGGHLRGMTYRDCVMFEITVLKKHLGAALNIIRGLFNENGWTREDIRREKQVVLRQLENSGEWKHKQLMYDFFCKAPAGECVLGTKNKILRCTQSNILHWKNVLFNPMNAEIIAAGDITDADEKQIEATFSDIPKRSENVLSDIKPARFLTRTKLDVHDYEYDSDFCALSLAFDIDTKEINRRAAEILHSALARGLLAPFNMRLREELGLLDEITSGCEFYNFGGIMYFMFEASKTQADVLLGEISRLFSEQTSALDVRAFECARAAFTDRAKALDFTPRDFAYILAFDDGIDSFEQYISQNSKVAYDDVSSAAKEIFREANVTVNTYN